MLTFIQGDNSDVSIIVTLTEMTTIPSPVYYLFVFTHTETKQKMKLTNSGLDDVSEYKYRYNKWIVHPAVIFQDFPLGSYTYTVYQKSNIDDQDENENEIVEQGRAVLLPSQEFSYDQYETTTNFKSYNG